MIEDIAKAEEYAKRARKTKPPCPVLTAAAIQHYDNAQVAIAKRLQKLNGDLDALKDN